MQYFFFLYQYKTIMRFNKFLKEEKKRAQTLTNRIINWLLITCQTLISRTQQITVTDDKMQIHIQINKRAKKRKKNAQSQTRRLTARPQNSMATSSLILPIFLFPNQSLIKFSRPKLPKPSTLTLEISSSSSSYQQNPMNFTLIQQNLDTHFTLYLNCKH